MSKRVLYTRLRKFDSYPYYLIEEAMNEEKPLDYCDDKSLVPYGDNRGAPAFRSNDREVLKWKSEKEKSNNDYFRQRYQEIEQEFNKLKEGYDINKMIGECDIRFTPVIGQEYYLYERSDGTLFMSLVAVEEWNRGDLTYRGTFKLDSHDVWIQMDS